MAVRRIMPIITVADIATASRHHTDILGLTEVMNHGWIATFADPETGLQLSLMTTDLTAPCNPAVSVEVDDVDAAYARALASGVEIVHELQPEDWGVRRFFYRDTDGTVVNVLQHL
ncbi:MAG: VOC family protein [Corynebacteriales bacterium]|nr:VOC family protein [Mycobacteriales bacterium]